MFADGSPEANLQTRQPRDICFTSLEILHIVASKLQGIRVDLYSVRVMALLGI
jgi:hypothetical protein